MERKRRGEKRRKKVTGAQPWMFTRERRGKKGKSAACWGLIPVQEMEREEWRKKKEEGKRNEHAPFTRVRHLPALGKRKGRNAGVEEEKKKRGGGREARH